MKRLLAKSYDRKKYGDVPPDYALLTQHSRDVAEACGALAHSIGKLALANAGLNSDVFDRFVTTLTANGWIQDLGKANSHFQSMVRGSPEIIQLLRHEAISGILALSDDQPLRAWLGEKLTDEMVRMAIWGAMGHHRKFDEHTRPQPVGNCQMHVSHEDFMLILAEMATSLGLSPPPVFNADLRIARTRNEGGDICARDSLRSLQDGFKECAEQITDPLEIRELALIKGFGIAADVAASGFAAQEISAFHYSLREFVTEAMSIGLSSHNASKIISQWAQNRSMPADFVPRKFQSEVAASDSYLTFAQAGCGSGKSLAAYLWAQKWCHKFEDEGRTNFRLFFCLPTTGTTTEHFKDYALETGLDAELLSLTHSRSRVDLRLMAETAAQEDVNEGSSNPAQDALNAERDKIESLALWGTPFVVTTTDTVLGLMANARRSIYSLPALMCGAMVLDEVHAFDDYLFGHLLMFIKNFPKIPVLLMTASLSKERVAALRQVRPDLNSVPGPPEFEDLERYVIREAANQDELWEEIGRCLVQNGKVLWIRNRVDWANDTYEICRKRFVNTAVDVYHARLRYRDRSKRHRRVIDNFKNHGKAALLVATQVAEMSLDLSADLLVTDIASIPALIQRMGRLNRQMTPDVPRKERKAKPAIICALPVVGKDVELPYSEIEIETAQEWLQILINQNGAVSQRHLSEAFAQFSDEQLFDLKAAEERACFFSGLWQTRPGMTRGEGYTISIILEQDKLCWESEHPREAPSRDWLREHEVSIPIRDAVLQWGKFGGLRVAPRATVAYDFDETTQEGTGARWLSKQEMSAYTDSPTR